MKPTNPFIVRGYRGSEYFCDREIETRKIISALTNERNVTLMAPRRYGKTGLVRNIFYHLPQDVVPVYVDIYSTTNLQEFTQMFAAAVLGALDTVADKAFAAIGRFFRAVRPTATPDGLGGVTFSFSVEKAHVETTLKGAFDYLASKEKRVVVAIDEFQQILEYPEKGTEALLRSYIQFLENANFIFAGSRHHLMGEMFTSPRRPFYQSTDILSSICGKVLHGCEARLLARGVFKALPSIRGRDVVCAKCPESHLERRRWIGGGPRRGGCG